MEENLYSIKINKTGRYVSHCDDCWYETCDTGMGRYTKEQAAAIVKQMRRHYVYDMTVSNGTDTQTYGLKPQKPVEANVKPAGTKKNFIVKLKRK